MKILKSELFQSLQRVVTITERSTLPILKNVLLETHKDTLFIYATDLETAVKLVCPAKIESEQKITVNASLLFSIVKELSSEYIDFSLDNSILNLNANNSTFKLPTIPPTDFPILNLDETILKTETEPQILLTALNKTLYAAGNDCTRMFLNGVYFKDNEVVATDGFRFAYTTIPINIDFFKDGILLPKKGLIDLKKILSSASELRLEKKNNFVLFQESKLILSIRLIEGNFINYKKILVSYENKFEVPRQNLIAAIRRVSLVSETQSTPITLKLRKNRLTLKSQSPELGEAREELEIKNSKDLEIIFNARFLLDALASFEQDNIIVELNDDKCPIILRAKDSMAVIMPIKQN